MAQPAPSPVASTPPTLLPSPAAIFLRRLGRSWASILVGFPASVFVAWLLWRWAVIPPRAGLVGIILAVLLVVTASIWIRAIWRAVRASRIVWRGEIAEASVIALSSDQSMKINGRHPKVLKYLFFLPGTQEKIRGVSPHLRAGEVERWHVGDKLTIAYLPAAPAETVILSDPPPRAPRAARGKIDYDAVKRDVNEFRPKRRR